jgi:cyclase
MRILTVVWVVCALVFPVQLLGQGDLSIQPIKEDLFAILRPNGNVGVRLGPEGVILVDDEYPEGFAEIEQLVGEVSDQPVLYILSAKTSVAPERVRVFGPREPDFQTAVHMGGLEVRAVYVGPGRAPSDAVIYFPDLGAVVGGDLLHPGAPLRDYARGGRIDDWVQSLNDLLALDFETAVPKHQTVQSRADVVRLRDRASALQVHMSELARVKASKREIGNPIRMPGIEWRLR